MVYHFLDGLSLQVLAGARRTTKKEAIAAFSLVSGNTICFLAVFPLSLLVYVNGFFEREYHNANWQQWLTWRQLR